MSLTKVSYAMINGDPVNVLDYGAVGDGITNDTAALQAAAAVGRPIYLPEGSYLISSTVTLTNDLYGFGEIKYSGITAISINADYVTIDGITFTGVSGSGTVADCAVASTQSNYLTIRNCVITNSTVRIRNQQLAYVYGFRFQNNTINANFTGVEHITNQNDVLVIRGVNGVWITGNDFTVLNVHRVFKIADTEAATTAGTAYRDRNIYITNNRVVGSTDSGKQCMDLYFFTSDIVISANTFEVTGFSRVVENKTGLTQNYNQNTIISNNKMSNDNACIVLQGSYGSTTPAYDVGYQNAIIEGNVLISTAAALGGTLLSPLNLRFYNSMQVINNNVITPIIFAQTTGLSAIEVGSCGYAIINNNSISNGAINNVVYTTNSEGDSFDSIMNSIEIQGNTIANFGGTGTSGGVIVSSVNKPTLSVNINSNYVKQDVDDAASAGCVAINSSTFNNLIVSNNIGVMANAAEQRMRFVTSTVTEVIEQLNSWNQIGRTSAVYDPPSVASGAVTTTTLTVTDAVATDIVGRVNFTRALQGLIMTGWVSAADTVTVQLYNPTGGAIDLASGTLYVVVNRYTAI